MTNFINENATALEARAYVGFYKPCFDKKHWQVKMLGELPSNVLLGIAHCFGKPGKQTLALAMCLRECGASDAHICYASSGFDGLTRSQNNFKGSLEKAGLIRRNMAAPRNAMNHTVYQYDLTAKGEAFVKRILAGTAKAAEFVKVQPAAKAAEPVKVQPATKAPAKAKAASKPRRAKAPKPVEVPALPIESMVAELQANAFNPTIETTH